MKLIAADNVSKCRIWGARRETPSTMKGLAGSNESWGTSGKCQDSTRSTGLEAASSRFTFKPCHKARLLAVAASHSGNWLHTLPISACGLQLEDNIIRVAVSLRLGCAICETHACLCGATVDSLGQHALSCKKKHGHSTTSCLAQRLNPRSPHQSRNSISQGAVRPQYERWQKAW